MRAFPISSILVFAVGLTSDAQAARDTPTARNEALRKCTSEGHTTNDVEVCIANIVGKSEQELGKYLKYAHERIGKDKETLAKFEAAQKAFETYKESMCDAVYQNWAEGTIRGTKAQCCKLRIIDQRALSVWEEFVRYEDSSEPPLPGPAGQLCDPE